MIVSEFTEKIIKLIPKSQVNDYGDNEIQQAITYALLQTNPDLKILKSHQEFSNYEPLTRDKIWNFIRVHNMYLDCSFRIGDLYVKGIRTKSNSPDDAIIHECLAEYPGLEGNLILIVKITGDFESKSNPKIETKEITCVCEDEPTYPLPYDIIKERAGDSGELLLAEMAKAMYSFSKKLTSN